MAAIVTNEDFARACGYLVNTGLLPVVGERQIIPAERKVYDQTAPGIENRTDITPSTQTLESALDNANAQIAEQAADDAVQSGAKAEAASVPNYASWTFADFQAWYDANLNQTQIDLVTSLAAARVMMARQNAAINALAKMVIALRNRAFPDLQD